MEIMKIQINKVFNEFMNGLNSRFVELEFKDTNKFIFDKGDYKKVYLKKAELSRGNIEFLRQRIINVINKRIVELNKNPKGER